MIRSFYHIALSVIVCLHCFHAAGNIYVVIYATIDGRTGHAGIAIDNYRVQEASGSWDTVADGTLTYYDLWPKEDDFALFGLSKDRTAVFYKLPNAIWSSAITVNSLYDQGIPHREHYPCDALLLLRSTAGADQLLKLHLDSVIGSGRAFNPRKYNCSDFVADAIKKLTGISIRAKEFLPFQSSTTPNKLCRKLMARSDISVIKSPGKKINGSFFRERILKKKPPPVLWASQ